MNDLVKKMKMFFGISFHFGDFMDSGHQMRKNQMNQLIMILITNF